MASTAFDPLTVPDEFWAREEVGGAVDHRDVGELFGLLSKQLGASQTRIGTATGLAQGTVCDIMNGRRQVMALDVLERIADGLGMPDATRVRLGLAPRDRRLVLKGSGKEDATKRRTALNLGVATAVSPETLWQVLRDSAGEAMEFTRASAVSGVGAGTLDHLEAVVSDLDQSYFVQPLGELFIAARAYRQRVEELVQGRHTLTEECELYAYAAWLSQMLAWLGHDLGFPITAEAYAIDCYQHADQAGQGVLCAWAADAMASIAMHADRPGKAVLAAQKGIGKIPDRHPLAVALRTQAARAYARQGQGAECVEWLSQAQELHERLPARSPGRLGVDNNLVASRAIASRITSSYLWLADYQKAQTYARAALAVYESTTPADRSPSREAVARIDLGIALVHLGSLDEALAHGSQALSSARVTDTVLARSGELDRALMTCFPKEAIAQSFHEQYQQITRRANRTNTA